MLTDYDNIFCVDQAVTASAASTDYIDLKAAREMGAGEPIHVFVRVTEDFATLTSLTVGIQTDDNTSFSSAATKASSGAIAAAALLAGTYIPMPALPPGTNERYMRLYFTVAGTNASAGKITAGLVPNKPANKAVTA